MTIDFNTDLIEIVKNKLDFDLSNAIINYVDLTYYAFFVILKNEDKYCFVNLHGNYLKIKRVYLSSNPLINGKYVARRFNEFFYHNLVNYKIIEAYKDRLIIKNINPCYIITKETIQIKNTNEIPVFLTTVELLKNNLTYKEIENFLLENWLEVK